MNVILIIAIKTKAIKLFNNCLKFKITSNHRCEFYPTRGILKNIRLWGGD